MRLLVCGSRFWGYNSVAEQRHLIQVLDTVHRETPITLLIEGEAKGADTLARHWAERNGIRVAPFPANWTQYKRAAGPIRNAQMLKEGRPEQVIAFHNNLAQSKGTAHMVQLARKAGVPIQIFPHP